MRLDKYLVTLGIGSRSQVKEYVRKGLVTVNDAVCRNSDTKVDETADRVAFQGRELVYKKNRYYMLHKPAGVITATRDREERTVLELLGPEVVKKDLSPMGRLDKDTEGLLLITDDGELNHLLLSPRHHVDKCYLVYTALPVSMEAAEMLRQGVEIGEDKPTLPACVELTGDRELLLTIQEGKFHQVKRMLQAVDNQVIYLKRISFGGLTLDPALQKGQYRELTKEEVLLLRTAVK